MNTIKPFWIVSTIQKLSTKRILSANVGIPVQLKRTLVTEESLGISNYEAHRLRVPKSTKFDTRQLATEIRLNNTIKVCGLTKQWIHVLTKEELENYFHVLRDALRLAHKSADVKFSFGTIVMRMFHYLNMPNKALELYNDAQMGDTFNRLSCNLILCDSLFNNGMYEELIELIKRNRQAKGGNLSKFLNYFLFAACYKSNSQNHFNYALDIWNTCEKSHQLGQTRNFLGMLAVNQGHPEKAFEILPPQPIHFADLNVRLMALAECGRFEDIRETLKENMAKPKNGHQISKEAIQRINEKLDKINLDEGTNECNKHVSDMCLQATTTNVTIDELICWPMKIPLRDENLHSMRSAEGR